MKFTIASLATLAALSTASPVSPSPRAGIPSLKQLQCTLIGDIASLVSKVNNGGASSFCSSYIASTITTTKTSTVTSITTSTNTIPLTASTTTITTALAPTSTAIVYSDCAQPGYDLTPSYNFDGSGAYGTFATCSARCAADPSCVSFAVGAGACLLYSVPVASNLNPVATSPYYFYDRKCPPSSAPADTAAPAPANATVTAPAKRALVVRAVATPAAFNGLQPAKISSVCSCVISRPNTSTLTASTTTTLASTIVVNTSVTVTTNVITSVITPAPVTVTFTRSVA